MKWKRVNGVYQQVPSVSRLETLIVLFFLACLLLVFVTNVFQKFTQQQVVVAETVHDLREIITDCRSMPRHYPTIKTVYNAPSNQPRKPIRWLVTCDVMYDGN